MKDFTTTEAERAAKKKWQDKNKEKAKSYTYKSNAKNFILKHASIEELDFLLELIKERREELKNNEKIEKK